MAAGMHHPRGFGGVGQPGLLQDGQRIHVGAQADRAPAAAVLAADHADHAGLCKPGMDFIDAEFAELVLHDAAGADLLQRQLGVLMQVMPPRRHLRLEIGDAIDDRHDTSSGGDGEIF